MTSSSTLASRSSLPPLDQRSCAHGCRSANRHQFPTADIALAARSGSSLRDSMCPLPSDGSAFTYLALDARDADIWSIGWIGQQLPKAPRAHGRWATGYGIGLTS
jgi:hypothetical protein